jgi:hypothetical protein
MSKAFEEIAQEAAQLTREERLNLAGLLLQLNESVEDSQVDATWEKELMARIRAIDEGSATGFSYQDVMRDADDRLTS